MKNQHLILLAQRIHPLAGPLRALGILGLALLLGRGAQAQTILGSTGNFAVMAGSTVTINGATITGNLGAANIAGGGFTTLTGTQVIPVTATPYLDDLTKAFNGLAAMPMTPTIGNLTGKILGTTAGAIILTPGVYHFNTTAQLTGNLILDAQNQSNAVWVFQIGSALTTAAGSTVTIINPAGGDVASDGIFWQIGTAATFGTGTMFEGNVLGGSAAAFTFDTGATINHGRALTGTTGTITLTSNTINFIAANSGYSGGLAFDVGGNVVPATAAVPEPATYALLAGAVALVAIVVRRRSLGACARAHS